MPERRCANVCGRSIALGRSLRSTTGRPLHISGQTEPRCSAGRSRHGGVQVRRTHLDDRRVGKTRQGLHEALASLIHEKSYDAIAIKELLSRANVGRSTFYTHYRNKGELLKSGVHDALGASVHAGGCTDANGAADLLRFSLPLLRHIGAYRGPNVSSGVQRNAIVHDHLAAAIAAFVAAGIRQVPQPMRNLVAAHVASAFVLVVNRWMTRHEALSPETADEWFRTLTEPVLSRVLGA